MAKFFKGIAALLISIVFVTAYLFYGQSSRSETAIGQPEHSITALSKHEEGENPGVFYEALARLKTTRDGRTYPPNYRQRALSKALEAKNGKTPIMGVEGVQGAAHEWKEIGPGNVSGRSRAVVVDPSDLTGNTWFVATIGGGVWKTSNAGETWENKTEDLLTLTTTTLAIATSNPNIIYVGTGMGYGRIVDLPGSGIWKSIDGGDSWTQLKSTANGELFDAINRIIIDPNDSNIVLACSNGFSSHLGPKPEVNGTYGEQRKSGIFRSTDGGDTWNQVFNPDTQIGTSTDNRVQQLLANPTDFNTIYATVNEVGIIKSTDAGLNWSVITNNFVNPGNIGVPGFSGFGLEGISARTEMAIAPTDPNRLYAAVERPNGQSPKFFMSVNAGATWQDVVDTGNDPSWFDGNGVAGRNSAWFNNTILVSPYDENIVFVGGVNTYKIEVNPSNATRTTVPINWWIPTSNNLPVVHADHHFIASIPVDEATNSFKLIMANDGGIAYSEDSGENWRQITGLNTTQFYGVDKKPGANVYVGGLQDNGTWLSSEDPGPLSNWTEVGGGDGVEVAWNADDPNQIIIGSQSGNLRKSRDGGLTFAQIPDAKAGFSPFISKVANSKTDPDLVFTVGQFGVKRSDDFGDTWTLTSITGNWIGDRPFDNVEISDADPRTVWISSRLAVDPPRGIRGGIHLSRDGGLSFSEISSNFPETVTEASGIAPDPHISRTAYFLFSAPGQPKILKTGDFGQTFVDFSGFGVNSISTGFPDVGVFSLLVMPYDTRVLWAGTEIGLFTSEDGGITWSIDDNGLPHVAIFQMSIVDDQVVVATQGRGVWTTTLPELTNYIPPTVVLVPRIETLTLSPEENGYKLGVNLKSAYDSAEIISNGRVIQRLEANANPEILTSTFPVTTDETVTAKVTAYKNGETYESAARSLIVFPVETVNGYASSLDKPAANLDFITQGFRIGQDAGFSTPALHSDHPYIAGGETTAILKKSIIVATQDAYMNFEQVVLIEPGNSDNYLDPLFFDYVIVEATANGVDWIPLTQGYDSKADTAWLSAFNNGFNGFNSISTGNESLLRKAQQIDLLETFNPGDKIFIRFRLLSDPGTVGWGWTIDNIEIQQIITGFTDRMELGQLAIKNYPNPTQSESTIQYFLPAASQVGLTILDIDGHVLLDMDLGFKKEGIHEYQWDAKEQREGLYIIKLSTRNGSVQSKLVKTQ